MAKKVDVQEWINGELVKVGEKWVGEDGNDTTEPGEVAKAKTKKRLTADEATPEVPPTEPVA